MLMLVLVEEEAMYRNLKHCDL